MKPNPFYIAIDRHRATVRRISIRKFADEIGVPYDVAWNTLKRGTKPADYNRQPFLDYYLAHEAEVAALIELPEVMAP